MLQINTNEAKFRFTAQTKKTITKIRIIILFWPFKNWAGIESWKQNFFPLDNQDTVNNFKSWENNPRERDWAISLITIEKRTAEKVILCISSSILKLTVFTLLLAISKRFELQKPDWAHLVDFLMKINLPFLKTFLAFLEVEISLKEHDPKSLF